MGIRLKRIYDPAEADDGYRVLVDRLWPRGVAKADARLDAWHRALAPSKALREWFGHDRERWPDFRSAYARELADSDPGLLAELREHAGHEGLTLLYAARDTECNNAVVLKQVLEQTP
ncbi:DUF488 domain-containing protein [Salinisphaera hydrothermalis]|uniref:Uroporphyrin-III C-methyltransferase n=1 Tax=Salinisphaera hydrothermalis (strain C41B8) TaxID=1304275 RepID=A0A084IHS6_SALHC|nr:DUF488 domain-containing protein [Salinisphaera hydrothermalis]KEZ76260.1 hypothetical protein C41B8_15672 [Salinisphaera hydrothermalis C41B8]